MSYGVASSEKFFASKVTYLAYLRYCKLVWRSFCCWGAAGGWEAEAAPPNQWNQYRHQASPSNNQTPRIDLFSAPSSPSPTQTVSDLNFVLFLRKIADERNCNCNTPTRLRIGLAHSYIYRFSR